MGNPARIMGSRAEPRAGHSPLANLGRVERHCKKPEAPRQTTVRILTQAPELDKNAPQGPGDRESSSLKRDQVDVSAVSSFLVARASIVPMPTISTTRVAVISRCDPSATGITHFSRNSRALYSFSDHEGIKSDASTRRSIQFLIFFLHHAWKGVREK